MDSPDTGHDFFFTFPCPAPLTPLLFPCSCILNHIFPIQSPPAVQPIKLLICLLDQCKRHSTNLSNISHHFMCILDAQNWSRYILLPSPSRPSILMGPWCFNLPLYFLPLYVQLFNFSCILFIKGKLSPPNFILYMVMN